MSPRPQVPAAGGGPGTCSQESRAAAAPGQSPGAPCFRFLWQVNAPQAPSHSGGHRTKPSWARTRGDANAVPRDTCAQRTLPAALPGLAPNRNRPRAHLQLGDPKDGHRLGGGHRKELGRRSRPEGLHATHSRNRGYKGRTGCRQGLGLVGRPQGRQEGPLGAGDVHCPQCARRTEPRRRKLDGA